MLWQMQQHIFSRIKSARHPSVEASDISPCQYVCKASVAACQPGSWQSRKLARVRDAVMAHLSGKLHVIRPHNGSNERFQSSLVTAEEGLVVALILIVLLGWLGGKDGVTVVPAIIHSIITLLSVQ